MDDCTVPVEESCDRQAGGNIIINPIRSAQLTTKNSFSYRFGRVEVVAKTPRGDWLWPGKTAFCGIYRRFMLCGITFINKLFLKQLLFCKLFFPIIGRKFVFFAFHTVLEEVLIQNHARIKCAFPKESPIQTKDNTHVLRTNLSSEIYLKCQKKPFFLSFFHSSHLVPSNGRHLR